MSDRLQKFLANKGLGSRREIETWIEEGRIRVNGDIAELGLKVTEHDKIILDGEKLQFAPTARTPSIKVIMYHKPEGEICTRSDEEDRNTVFDNLPNLRNGRWVMVGRLDVNTSGLLLFTNNGELANRLMHPKYQVSREYAVRILGEVNPAMLKRLRAGVQLDDGLAKFDTIQFKGGDGANQWYHVTLSEGRNREVRRLWESQDVKVSRLIRVSFGPIKLPRPLPRRRWRYLTPDELQRLLARSS